MRRRNFIVWIMVLLLSALCASCGYAPITRDIKDYKVTMIVAKEKQVFKAEYTGNFNVIYTGSNVETNQE